MTIELIPVSVECYSGYKADEYPKCIIREGVRLPILQVIDRWYQRENISGFPAADYFKAGMEDGSQCIIKHDLDNDTWYLVTG
jgi:hypothetical protein